MKKLVASGVAALSIAAGSAAVAAIIPMGTANAQTTSGATGTTTTQQAPAERVSPLKSVLDAAVADGTITQAQADAISAKMDAWHAANPAPDKGDMHRGGGAPGANMDAVAAAIGITADDLHTQLDSGKTLAAIAGDKVEAVRQVLTDAANARIDQGVTDGRITADTAATMKAGVAAKVQAMLDGTGGMKLPGGPGGRGDHGPRGAAPAAPGATTTPSSTTASSGSTTTA